jgi:3'(2'), 5'-bisphosphate nucleotidase
LKQLLHKAIQVAIDASNEIMYQYTHGFETEHKKDNSPLTTADRAAHILISEKLGEPNLPVLSEEGNHFSHTERMKWERYWIIDPIDGTREFVNKTDEFCVCIALIENKKSVLGIIAAPAKNLFYFGSIHLGAFTFDLDFAQWKEYKNMRNIQEIISKSTTLPTKKDNKTYKLLSSKNYKDPKTISYIQNKKNEFPNLIEFSCGSAIKFGLLAQGEADEYTRLSPLSFWDIAAGDALIKSAGMKILSSETHEEIIYTDPNMKIAGFHAFRNPHAV